MTKRASLRARNSSIRAVMDAAKGSSKAGAKTAPAANIAPSGGEKPVSITTRLTPDQHDKLRQIAFDRRVSIHSLLIEGVQGVLEKYSAS